MVFGTKDGNPLYCCAPTVLNPVMTGDGTVDPNDPTTGGNLPDYWVGPGVPTFTGQDGWYYIDDQTGEIYKWEDGKWVDTGSNVATCAGGNNNDDDDTTDTFIDAPTARSEATRTAIINSEIEAIKKAISSAVALNQFDTTVSGTTMTDVTTGIPYFRTWKDMDPCHPLGYDTREIVFMMDQVIKYFFDLKYVIERYQPTTENNFVWKVYW